MISFKYRFLPACEQMESRDTPSASFNSTNGTLTIVPEWEANRRINAAIITADYRNYGDPRFSGSQVEGRVRLNGSPIGVDARRVKAIVVKGTDQNDYIHLGGVNTGNFFKPVLSGNITIKGNKGGDDITGSAFNDNLYGGGGRDKFSGLGGQNDTLFDWQASFDFWHNGVEDVISTGRTVATATNYWTVYLMPPDTYPAHDFHVEFRIPASAKEWVVYGLTSSAQATLDTTKGIQGGFQESLSSDGQTRIIHLTAGFRARSAGGYYFGLASAWANDLRVSYQQ